jgi:hypothetical protein
MDAFSIAKELLGDMKLTSGQLGQLRALDYRLLLERQRLTERPPPRPPQEAGGALAPDSATEVDPSPAQLAVLRAMIVDGIMEMLTTEQRASLEQS